MQMERYPVNWKEISLRIREREEWHCKWCGAANGAVGARDKNGLWHDEDAIHHMNSDQGHELFGEFPDMTKIVLTVAHLGTPILSDWIGPLEFPFFFQVAGTAKTDEVFQAIRFLVALQAKQFKGALMMHDGAIAERFAVFPAGLAGVVVPQSSITPSLLPSGTIITKSATFPVGIGFTNWSLFRKPFEPTGITAKPIPLTDLVAAYFVDLPAIFTSLSRQGPIPSLGINPMQFSIARIGTGFLVCFSLFDRQGEDASTDNAGCFGWRTTNRTIRDSFSKPKLSPVILEALSRADFLIVGGLIDRQWKELSTDNTIPLGWGLPSFSAGTRELLSKTTTAQEFTSASIGTCALGARSVRDIKSSLADFADFCFHTCIIPQYHTGEQIPYYTPGDKHDKMDVRDENLAALCQKCHLNYDRDEHMANAAKTRERKRLEAGQLQLLEVA